MKQKGFTLIELLAVLAIISILTAITVTTVLKRVKEVEIKVSDQVAEVIYSSARTYINGKIYEYPLINSTSYCIKLKNLLDSGDLRDSFFAGTELTENDYVRVFVSDGKYTYALYNTCTTGTTDVTPPVNVTVTEVSKTTNSITVSTSANDPDSDITKYEFRIDSNSYIDNGTTNTYTFTGVSSGSHTIKIRVTNAFDLSTESTTVTISTDSIGTPTYAINPASGYAQSKVVTISYPTGSGLTYSYNKDGAGYVSAMQTQTVTFTANGYISARVSDGTNMVTASTYNVTGIDNTSPSIPTLASNSATHNSITAVYNASVDSESGINEYVCYYGATSNPATVGSISGTTCTFNSLSLGVTYYFKICATNGVGLTTCSTVSSDQTEDLTPPSTPILASSSATYNSITAIYNASTDSESGISSYSCYYGTTSTPTTLGSLSGTTCTFNSLNSSTTYYFKICATNGVGTTTCSTVSNKETEFIDTTAPVNVTVNEVSKTTNSITVSTSATDPDSAITKYEFSIDSGAYIDNGTTSSYTFTGVTTGSHAIKIRATNAFSLSTESTTSNISTNSISTPTYAISPASGWATSKTVTITYPSGTGLTYTYNKDGAGYVSATQGQGVAFGANGYVIARVSDGTNTVTASTYNVTQIDNTAPTNVTVTEGTKTTNSITVSTSASDPDSGISKYEFSIDSGAYIDNGTTSSYTFTGVTTGSHAIKIRATNGVGLTTESTASNISTNTISTPTYAISPASGWATSKTVTISYPSGSGLTYTYSKDGGAYVSATQSQNVVFTANGYVIARVSDGTNTVTASTYNVTQIDNTSPSTPSLSSSDSDNSTITAVYGASTDSESGISGYNCYYGTTASPTTAGSLSGTTCTFSGLNSGTTYYFKMCATNGVSMTTCSTVSNRDTTAGDTTAPSAPTLASSSATFSSITATYNAAVDNESGISSYTCYYGTTANPSTSSTPSGTTCNFSGLSGGTTYYFKMCATNGVSLTTCSDVSNLPIYTTTTNFAYTGGEQTYVVPASGTYTLTVYGAQGGYLNSSYGLGGKGGYVTGKIYLTAGTVLYVYVGGQGSYTTATSTWAGGGFNGGGTATYYGGGGGGATDIRVGNNTLYHRVVVAGGGGGAQGRASASYIGNGGNGGSYTGSGNDGTYYNGNTTTTYTGKGGSQTAGGAAGVYASYPATAGVFGVGGNAGRYSSTTYRGSGGGGGGWYGGGGGAYRYAGGGGGSGYAWCQMFAGNVPAGYALSSAYYMSDMAGQPGNNSGNGSAIITYYSS